MLRNVILFYKQERNFLSSFSHKNVISARMLMCLIVFKRTLQHQIQEVPFLYPIYLISMEVRDPPTRCLQVPWHSLTFFLVGRARQDFLEIWIAVQYLLNAALAAETTTYSTRIFVVCLQVHCGSSCFVAGFTFSSSHWVTSILLLSPPCHIRIPKMPSGWESLWMMKIICISS